MASNQDEYKGRNVRFLSYRIAPRRLMKREHNSRGNWVRSHSVYCSPIPRGETPKLATGALMGSACLGPTKYDWS